jgi:hypothetical protein
MLQRRQHRHHRVLAQRAETLALNLPGDVLQRDEVGGTPPSGDVNFLLNPQAYVGLSAQVPQ